jgi:hypothetical protein
MSVSGGVSSRRLSKAMYEESISPHRSADSGKVDHPWSGAISQRVSKALTKYLPVAGDRALYAAIHADTSSCLRAILESTISDVDSALEEVVTLAESHVDPATIAGVAPKSTPPVKVRPRRKLEELAEVMAETAEDFALELDAAASSPEKSEPEPEPEPESGGDEPVSADSSEKAVRFSEFVELLKKSPAKVVERITKGALKEDVADGAVGNPDISNIVGLTLDKVDKHLVKLNNRLVADAKKIDEKLDNYIQYLLAKVAEADKPLSAIDMEKEERTQKQKKATEDLLADNQQIFTLWNELVCAKEIHADLMRQRRCIAVSYGRPHDSDIGDVSVFASIPEEAQLPSEPSGEFNITDMSVAGISSSEDDDSDDEIAADEQNDTGSTASVSTLTEEQLGKRIATMESMIKDHMKEMLDHCYYLINFTPKPGSSKKDGTEFLKEIKKLKISTDATSAEHATTLKNHLISWLSCNMDSAWAVTAWFVRWQQTGAGGFLCATQETVDIVVNQWNTGNITDHAVYMSKMKDLGFQPGPVSQYTVSKFGKKYFDATTESGKAHIQEDQRRQLQRMVTEFSDAIGKVYTLLNATLPDLVKSTVDYNGGTLGDYRENRVSRAARDDGLTVIEAWLLATETYGREAVEHVRNHLKHGMAYFIETDYKSAMTKLLKVVDRAVALDTRITYAQSIEYYMEVLRQQRHSMSAQLEPLFGKPPLNPEEDQKRRIRDMASQFRNKMDKADTITKQLMQRQSDKNFRKRALDTLAVFESMYVQSSPPVEGASDGGGRNTGQNTGQSKYVALDKRDAQHWKRKNFNGAQDRNRHFGIYDGKKRCCDATGPYTCGHKQLDGKAKKKFGTRQTNSDQRWKTGHKNFGKGKFAAPYGIHLCTECIELAIKNGKDAIAAIQPGVTLPIDAAKAALEVIKGDDDGEEQAGAEELGDDKTPTQRKKKKVKSAKAKVTAMDAEIAELKRENDLKEARATEVERQQTLDARLRAASRSGASRRSQRDTPSGSPSEHWGQGGDDDSDDDDDDDDDDGQ